MSDPQPRSGFFARFRRQNNAQQPITEREDHAASLASSFSELARVDMSIGRSAADRRDVEETVGRVTPDQITAAAAARAAELDDAMHNLTVGSTSSATAVHVAADAYGEWQHTAPDVADRAERLFAAAHDDVGATPTSSLSEIAAAADAVRFDDWARSAVRSGLRSAAPTQDDLSSGIVEDADVDGYVDAVCDTINVAMDRLEREPGSAATAVELAASAYAEHGTATNAEALYNAAHETAGITPAAPLSALVAEATAANDAADAATEAEYSRLWQEQQNPATDKAAGVDIEHPRSGTSTAAEPAEQGTATTAESHTTVSSCPMDVASSLRSAASAQAAPATPTNAPTRPTSSTQRGDGAER